MGAMPVSGITSARVMLDWRTGSGLPFPRATLTNFALIFHPPLLPVASVTPMANCVVNAYVSPLGADATKSTVAGALVIVN